MTSEPQDPNKVRAEILVELNNHMRLPFARELARLLANAPTDEDLRAFAKKSPDRHAQAVAIYGRLSGFDKIEIAGLTPLAAYAARIERMSDGELEAERRKRLGPPPA